MNRRKAFKIAAGTAVGLAAAGAAGFTWLRRWANPQTPLHYPFPAAASASGAVDALLNPTPQSRDLPSTDWAIEGPYYTPDTPLRWKLAASDTVGVPLTLRGRVLMPNGMPVVGAVLDVWSCDGRGVYDNEGFNLRGHQYTDAEGRFIVETVKPSDYSMLGGTVRRTPHVHFKVQGPNTRLLTTQLYFPDEPLNARDLIFDPKLTMSVQPAGTRGLAAEFNFVLLPPRDSSVSRV